MVVFDLGKMWNELNSGSRFQGKTKEKLKEDTLGKNRPHSSNRILSLQWLKCLIKGSLIFSSLFQDLLLPFPKMSPHPSFSFCSPKISAPRLQQLIAGEPMSQLFGVSLSFGQLFLY